MSEPKFTPGPWRVDETVRKGFGGGALPYLAIDCGGSETIHVCGNGTTFSKRDANLIAAAPDLYRALTLLISDNLHSFPDDALNKAHAAIAKAEGKC